MSLPVILRPEADAGGAVEEVSACDLLCGLPGSDRGAGCVARLAGCLRVAITGIRQRAKKVDGLGSQ
jgi:hypothetical protein